MNTKITLLFLVLSLIYGCTYRHVDRITPFHIYGQVYEQNSKVPLSDINIVFIDQGFDDRRQYRKEPLIIGHSNEQGKIDIEFKFWWGRSEGLLTGRAKKIFSIELTGKNHNSKQVQYKESDLQQENRIIQVPLGTIYLEPIN